MKTKSHLCLASLFLTMFLAIAFAHPVSVSAQPTLINPQTGLPMPPKPPVDPATGLPADGSAPFSDTNGAATWIDPNWKDPDKVLPAVDYNGLALNALPQMLRQQFNAAFDIILPSGVGGQGNPDSYQVFLQLKDVKASEEFTAMNMEFELDKAPWRWELTLNGSRQTALLRYLPQLVPPAPLAPPLKRIVVYVGNLLQTMKLEQISDAIQFAWQGSGLGAGMVQAYPAGDLLIISGTPDQTDLAQQTLTALNMGTDKDLEKSVEKLKILNALESNRGAALVKPQPAK